VFRGMLVLFQVSEGSWDAKSTLERDVAAFRVDGDAQGVLSVRRLKESFPEAGEFRFRALLANGIWKLLRGDEEEVPRFHDALPPQILAEKVGYSTFEEEQAHVDGDQNAEEFETFLDKRQAKEQVSSSESSLSSSDSYDSTSDDENLPTCKEKSPAFPEAHIGISRTASRSSLTPPLSMFDSGVSFLKNSARAALERATAGESLPNMQQKGVLENVQRKLRQPMDELNVEHLDFLKAIWKSSFRGEPLQMRAPQWQLLGFKSDNPLEDGNLADLGTLGFQSVAYCLGHWHGERNLDNVVESIMRINSSLVFDLGIHDGSFQTVPRKFWRLFDSGIGAYLELCHASFILANSKRRSLESDAEAVRSALDEMRSVLDRGPKTVEQLHSFVKKMNKFN